MSEYLLKAHEYIASIRKMTKEILEKVQNNQFDDVTKFAIDRFKMITELMTLSRSAEDNKELLIFFIEIEKDDKRILELVNQERQTIKKTLLNIDYIKEYISGSD